MAAFAANSILNRMALAGGAATPAAFAAIRLASGAAALAFLAHLSGQGMALHSRRRLGATTALLIYALGFSFAYLTLDAGIGALILFAAVQATMFGAAVLAGDRPPWPRWAGMATGLAGLAWLLLPGSGEAVAVSGAGLMVAAGIGWGAYSLIGRGATAPLGETAASFVAAAPVAAAVWALSGGGEWPSAAGWTLAILSGVVTSGLGYTLWYAVLPRLDTAVAGLAQLTVPVIAVTGGAAFLGEELTARIAAAGMLVLGGVAFGIVAGRRRPGA